MNSAAKAGWSNGRERDYTASESVSEQAMAFFMSNGGMVVWGMDLKWRFL
jgi:hypothetical protein